MNEKINVLDVNIDSCTAKEAMKETIAFLESEPVSVIDVVSVDGLMQMNDLSELKARMNEFDLVLPGEKLILEAAEEARLPKEIDIKLYLKMFMRYCIRIIRECIFWSNRRKMDRKHFAICREPTVGFSW